MNPNTGWVKKTQHGSQYLSIWKGFIKRIKFSMVIKGFSWMRSQNQNQNLAHTASISIQPIRKPVTKNLYFRNVIPI